MAERYSQEFLNEYIGYRLEAAAIACIIITTIFVGLRMLAQYVRPASTGWDDTWTVSAWAFLVAECGCCLYIVKNQAIGYHIVAQVLYRPGKIPLWGKWSLYIILATAMIVNIFTVIYQCDPREKAWNPKLPGTCNNIEAHYRWSALPNVFTDIVMLIIPIPMTMKLQCPTRTKVAIICTFLLGSLGLVTALFRMVSFFTTSSIPGADGTLLADSTWDGTTETIWIIVEPSVYLISACLLSSRVLINYMLNDTAFGTKTSSMIRKLWTSRSGSRYDLHAPNEAKAESDLPRSQQSDVELTTVLVTSADSKRAKPQSRDELYLLETADREARDI